MTKSVLIGVGRSVGRKCGIIFRTFEYNQKDRGEHQATMHSSIFFLYSRHRRPDRPKLSQRIGEMYKERDAHDGERPCDGSVKTIRRKRAKETGHLTLTRLVAPEWPRTEFETREILDCCTAGLLIILQLPSRYCSKVFSEPLERCRRLQGWH